MGEIAAREAISSVECLEILLHPWIGYLILPLFALANAGIPLFSWIYNGNFYCEFIF
ncbi:Na(+)/H(+) antiporter NhaA [Legionella gratiana]|uniref:Na(+)/H(+) antiporter NhaA n=1 Tax=Legionella gratiana TaxID=45066 RepID=A0A378JBB6_9GAMM|nr:Na+/H+ antiporter NhaA [Legionella gratiana]KTD10834.1 Na(+)/H(+) antiporter NhaA [Legionella gratiana]STX45164.1 Na(+)/H(+) antiporter nhaA 1 (Sodium/proton antiporter nhaA 1) [Legionella gratiana]